MNLSNTSPEQFATQVVKLYTDKGFTPEQAERAAAVALSLSLSIGVPTGRHSVIKKSENILNKRSQVYA